MKMNRSKDILSALSGMGIPFTLFEHEPKHSIQDCLNTPGLDPLVATVPRNVFACNRQQTAFYLILMSPMREFRTAQVSKLLGVSRLSFAREDKLQALLQLDKGAVSPLGLLFDTEHQVQLVIDDALLAYPRLWFHPGVNTQSVEMDTGHFLNTFLPGVRHTPVIITLPAAD